MLKVNLPTRPWVPNRLGILTLFVILVPVVMLNGVYTGSIVEVSNTLGILSEDITLAYYATSVGMAVAYPIVPKVMAVVTPKTLLLSDLFLQILLGLCCAHTDNMDIIIVCSFFIGFLKSFMMLQVLSLLKPVFTPRDVRSELYAYFYPIAFSGGQISMAITAQLAYYYQWQYMYYFTNLLLLVAMAFILFFFRYARRPVSFPYKDIDWKSILLISCAWLFAIYAFTYGKTLDWFSSRTILVYSLAIPVLIYLFIHRQKTQENPYVSLKPLGRYKSIIGYCFMALVMFLTATSSLVINYMNSIIRVDSVHANTLNLFLLPGFIVGGILCFWWFRWQRWRFRFLVAGGMFCYVIYLALLYFEITPYSTYEMLFLPMFFRGLGMLTLFIAFGVYVAEDLEQKLMLSNAFFLISFRSVLSPVIAASFFSNVLYYFQLKGMNVLSDNLTLTSPVASERYNQVFKSALSQGHEFSEAGQIAANTLYTTLQQQALLLGIKTIIGYALIGALMIAVICCFIPFHKTIKVAVVKTGDDMV
jgi:MFS family permease